MTDLAATSVGGLVGGVAAVVVSRAVVAGLVRDYGDLWSVGLLLVGLAMIGTGIGAWAALRLCGHDRAALTGVLFPIMSVVLAGAFLFLGVVLLPFLEGDAEAAAFMLGGVTAFFGGGVVARLLVTGGRPGDARGSGTAASAGGRARPRSRRR